MASGEITDRARDVVELLLASGVGAGVVGGFWAWLSSRPTGQAAVIEAAAKLQEALNLAAERQAESLTARVADLEDRLEATEGENRQLQQHIVSLEAVLRRQGLDIPSPPPARRRRLPKETT